MAVKPGLYKRVERPEAQVAMIVSIHAVPRLNDKTRPHVSEAKILRMCEEVLDEAVDVLYGHAHATVAPMNVVVRSKSGPEVGVVGLELHRKSLRRKDGTLADKIICTLQTVHGREGFVARSPSDYEMEVNGRQIGLVFDPSVHSDLREGVAMAVAMVLGEDEVEDETGYHVATDLVDFWMTPRRGEIEIELARFKRETYVLDVA